MIAAPAIAEGIAERLGPLAALPPTGDHIPTFWAPADRVPGLLRVVKEEVDRPHRMRYDLIQNHA